MITLISVLLLQLVATKSQLVGPGAMAPYGGGGGGGRRHGGYVRVQEPAKGFFIAGSAIRQMNGLYGKVERVPHNIDHQLQLAYKHDQTGWIMALTSGDDSEWLIIDNDARDRFKHKGSTIIPGSGQRWSHLHRAANNNNNNNNNNNDGTMPPPPRGGKDQDQDELDGALMTGGDDIAELPWQMIAVLDEGMLNKLRRYSAHHHGTVQRAIAGSNLPDVGGRNTETVPPRHVHAQGLAEANDVCINDGDFDVAMSLYGAAIDKVPGTSIVSTWSRAILLVQRAICKRKIGRDFPTALVDIETALDLYPAYTHALFEKGKILFDMGGKAQNSLHSFLQLLKVDRTYPKLDTWIVRCVAQDRRTKDNAVTLLASRRLKESSNAECVAWRQTKSCDPDGELESDQDKTCNQIIPRGISGFCECTVPKANAAGNVIGASVPESAKSKEIFYTLLNQVKKASKSSCYPIDRAEFTCNDKCIQQWKVVMKEAETYELSLRSEGQTTLEDLYRTGRMHLENWKYAEHRRFKEKLASKAHAQHKKQSGGARIDTHRESAYRQAWRIHDMYGVLGIAHDFTPNELKRAYRQESKANHPDKGGSDEAFQRVAAAKTLFSEPKKVDDYNRGTDLDNPDVEKTSLWEETEKNYFPERYGFEPFGDPLEDHPEGKAAHERRTERIENVRIKRAAGRQENIAGPGSEKMDL